MLSAAGWKRYVLLALTGATTTLAFAPFFLAPLLLVTLPFFMHATRISTSRKAAFLTGWWFGLGYSVASIYWFAYALLVDAAHFGWLIPFALFGIGGALALYYGLTTLAAYRFRTLPIIPYSLAFAMSWVVMEGLRSVLFSGFPWNLLGYSWGVSVVSLQAATIGGVWWLSLLTVTFASTPLWWRAGERRAVMLAGMFFFALLLYGAMRLHQHPTLYEPDIILRVVQANIPQTLKWDKNEERSNLEKHITLSLSGGYDKVTHLIWPESALPFRLTEGGFMAAELAKIVPPQGALATGVVRMDEGNIFNSLNVLTSDGHISAVYDKRKLVPFGEYVPLRSVLPLEKITQGGRDFSVGTDATSIPMHGAPDMRPQICYEAIFPHLSAGAYPHWILNITNDAWFGLSTGPYQHFAMTRMRAVEQGVPLIRAAGGGISAAVDAYGRVLKLLPLNTQGVLDTALPKPSESSTVYGKYGEAVLMVTILGMGVFTKMRSTHMREYTHHI
jgi:apolipoprotein N-acyltransferase